jgi:hypothetical protein
MSLKHILFLTMHWKYQTRKVGRENKKVNEPGFKIKIHETMNKHNEEMQIYHWSQTILPITDHRK